MMINLEKDFDDLEDMVTCQGYLSEKINYLDCRAKNVVEFNGEFYCVFDQNYVYHADGTVNVYAVKHGDSIVEIDNDGFANLYRLVVNKDSVVDKYIPKFYDVILVQHVTEKEAYDAVSDLMLDDEKDFTMSNDNFIMLKEDKNKDGNVIDDASFKQITGNDILTTRDVFGNI